MNWKLAVEKENRVYYVSDVGGRVKSVSKKTGVEKELVTCMCNKYMMCSGMTVHRLVAMAFVPNPDNKPYVDHIDGNRLNNDASNLRWVSPQENSANPITHKRQVDAINASWTEERRKNISDRMKSIPRTEEHNMKISQSVKNYYASKKKA